MSSHKTKRLILKKAMSVKYCDDTRFDYLDDDERPLIYKAMETYALQCMKKACKEQRENCVGGWRKSKDETSQNRK